MYFERSNIGGGCPGWGNIFYRQIGDQLLKMLSKSVRNWPRYHVLYNKGGGAAPRGDNIFEFFCLIFFTQLVDYFQKIL